MLQNNRPTFINAFCLLSVFLQKPAEEQVADGDGDAAADGDGAGDGDEQAADEDAGEEE